MLAASGRRLYHPLATSRSRRRAHFLRLLYVSIVLAVLVVAGCQQEAPLTAQEAMNVARSHMHGDALVQAARNGPLGELAPPGVEAEDPNRLVWVVTVRGTFQVDCSVDGPGDIQCPPEPKTGLIVLDYMDGSMIAITTITFLLPSDAPPTDATTPSSAYPATRGADTVTPRAARIRPPGVRARSPRVRSRRGWPRAACRGLSRRSRTCSRCS
jgi:hypothetical protein